MIGPFLDGGAVVTGGLAGAFLGHRLPANLRARMPMIFGLASMGLAVTLIIKVKFFPAVLLALILGTILGELCHLETAITHGATRARSLLDRFAKPAEGLSHEEFLSQFVALLVLFCASPVGIFGALTEGMTGDPSLLVIKAILDVFTAGIFAALLGYSLVALAVPLFLSQAAMFFLATRLMPLTTPLMLADFSACGGLLLLATGFRMAGMKHFSVANMLPALVLVMPISALWARFFAR